MPTNCIPLGTRKLKELRTDLNSGVYLIFRTSRYSDVSWYEHFTLVHMVRGTSFQTVVATSIQEEKSGLNPIKFSIWAITQHFRHLHWIITLKYNFNKI